MLLMLSPLFQRRLDHWLVLKNTERLLILIFFNLIVLERCIKHLILLELLHGLFLHEYLLKRESTWIYLCCRCLYQPLNWLVIFYRLLLRLNLLTSPCKSGHKGLFLERVGSHLLKLIIRVASLAATVTGTALRGDPLRHQIIASMFHVRFRVKHLFFCTRVLLLGLG